MGILKCAGLASVLALLALDARTADACGLFTKANTKPPRPHRIIVTREARPVIEAQLRPFDAKLVRREATPDPGHMIPQVVVPAVHLTGPEAAVSDGLHEELYFTPGSANVADRSAIESATRWLKDNPVMRVEVDGHADATGNPDANLALSKNRAGAVRDSLVSGGVQPSRIDVNGYGALHLKYPAQDPRNRRVTIEAKP